VAGLIVPAGYVVGLIFGIWGEVKASDRRGRMLATLANHRQRLQPGLGPPWHALVSPRFVGLVGRRTDTAGLSQHPHKYRPQRPILLAVDQELGEGRAQSRPSTKYTRSHPRIGWVLPGCAMTVG
jgi:hypothetical protein